MTDTRPMAPPAHPAGQNAAGSTPGRQPTVLYAADFQLVQECLRNDDRAWARLLAEYRPLCHAIAKNHGQAPQFDDIFSCFIIKLAGAASGTPGVLARYDGRASLKTFLSTVFCHMVIDAHRDTRRRSALVDTSRPVEDYHDRLADTDAAERADHAAAVGDLNAAMATLAAEDRRILDLYYFNEFTLKRIATVFRCSEATMSRRLKALVGKLRHLLAP